MRTVGAHHHHHQLYPRGDDADVLQREFQLRGAHAAAAGEAFVERGQEEIGEAISARKQERGKHARVNREGHQPDPHG